MAAAAFTQAQSSLRWFIDNFSVIADWRATLLRVANFRHAVITTDEPRGFESRIVYEEGDPGKIRIENLHSVSSAHADTLKEPKVVIEAGARVLVLGAPGTGKTQLFRALAGLWPWGSGRILRPRGEQIFYLPRGTPYLPRGSLREVLAYPLKAENFSADAFTRALFRLGLERLAPLVDETRRWDRELSQDEQLCLVFARMLIQTPPWVLIDGTFGLLDDDVLELVIDVFTKELKATGIIHIGGAGEAHDLFSAVLHLIKVPGQTADADMGDVERAASRIERGKSPMRQFTTPRVRSLDAFLGWRHCFCCVGVAVMGRARFLFPGPGFAVRCRRRHQRSGVSADSRLSGPGPRTIPGESVRAANGRRRLCGGGHLSAVAARAAAKIGFRPSGKPRPGFRHLRSRKSARD